MKKIATISIITAMTALAFTLSLNNKKSCYYELKASNVEALSYDEGPDSDYLEPCFYGSNGVGSDHFAPQYFWATGCGTIEYSETQIYYYGYPPCGNDIYVNYGSVPGNRCWEINVI